MIGTVATAALSVLASVATLAPISHPFGDDPPPGTDLPERRLAEFSFAIFVTIEFEVDPGEFSCAEPAGPANGNEITCFALVDKARVIVAVTTSSNGTGVYDWTVVSDHVIGATSPSTSSSTSTTSAPIANTNISDASEILSYGESLNFQAETITDLVIASSEGAVTAVNLYGWDAASATLTLDVTLDPTQNYGRDQIDRAAWVLAQALKPHWERGSPFRLQGSTLRPRLVLVVSLTTYVSDFDLMVRVADQLISNTDWIDAARQN